MVGGIRVHCSLWVFVLAWRGYVLLFSGVIVQTVSLNVKLYRSEGRAKPGTCRKRERGDEGKREGKD